MDVRKQASSGFDLKRLDRVGEAIRRDIEAGRVHGACLTVARHGEVVLDLAEGCADKAAGRAMDRNAAFVSMSVAKQFTNVMALSLVEKGLLRLHTPVADVIPEFGRLGKEQVNLFHLLTHTSGVGSAIPQVAPDVLTNIEKLTAYACDRPLESLAGERVNYSILIAHSIIAAMCLRVDGRGRSFARMIEEELFAPLGMNDTALGPRDDLLKRLCPVKVAQRDPNALLPAEAVEAIEKLVCVPGAELPAGGYLTTIGGVHRFAEKLRRGGELDGARILSPAMIDYCARNHTGARRNVLFDSSAAHRHWELVPAYIGIGFFVRGEGVLPGPFGVLNSPNTFGGLGAGSTAFWVDPQRDMSFAFLSTGLLEDSYHIERVALLSDLLIGALVD
jgi:CubicO group peptidase (beta-lactamase class C family)